MSPATRGVSASRCTTARFRDMVYLFWSPLPRNFRNHAAELSALSCMSPRSALGVVEVDVHRLHRGLLLRPVEPRWIRRRRGCQQVFPDDCVDGLRLRWLSGSRILHPRPLPMPCHREMVDVGLCLSIVRRLGLSCVLCQHADCLLSGDPGCSWRGRWGASPVSPTAVVVVSVHRERDRCASSAPRPGRGVSRRPPRWDIGWVRWGLESRGL